jgi:hypothetical protein
MCWSFIAATEQEIAGEIPSGTILFFHDLCLRESTDFRIAGRAVHRSIIAQP